MVLEAAGDIGSLSEAVHAYHDQRAVHHLELELDKRATSRHLSDTEQGTTAAFPEVTGDGAVRTSLLEVDPSTLVKVVANTFATPAEAALIRSGAVTAGQLRMCAQEHRNRRPFAESAPPLSEHAHYQAMVDSTIVASQEGEGL